MASTDRASGHADSDMAPSSDEQTSSTEDATLQERDAVPLSPVEARVSSSRWSSVMMPVRHVSRAILKWSEGPSPPQVQKIKPFFPHVQYAPVLLLDRYLQKRKHRLVALLAFYFCWLLAFAAILHHSAFSSEIEGYGKPAQLSCLATYW